MTSPKVVIAPLVHPGQMFWHHEHLRLRVKRGQSRSPRKTVFQIALFRSLLGSVGSIVKNGVSGVNGEIVTVWIYAAELKLRV
jgi:hypothetical protein